MNISMVFSCLLNRTILYRRPAAATVDARPSQVNFSTVAIVPVSEDVPLTAFTYELYHSLCAIGPCLRLTSDVVRKVSRSLKVKFPVIIRFSFCYLFFFHRL